MKTREQIIESMCMTWRHDYNFVVERHVHAFTAGMTEDERSYLRHQMAQIFDNDIAPYMEFKQDVPRRRTTRRVTQSVS